jgi:uncharacterized protein (TIGR02145 family)
MEIVKHLLPKMVLLTTAISGGNIADDGGATITERGICWSLTQNPTTSNSKVANGTGTGTYSCSITGLQGGKTYYVRAYAINSVNTSYGNQQSLTTTAGLATVTTTDPSAITSATATSGGNVIYEGGTTVTIRGVCWKTSANPTTANSLSTDGAGTGVFTSSLTSLSPGTTYYLRAYATNTAGTAYGDQKIFTTSVVIPTVTTADVSNILVPNASCGGNVTSTGGATVTARGVCWSISPNPTTDNSRTTDGTGPGSFTSTLFDLQSSATYYVRAYATNSAGTGYGTEKIFTMGTAPTVTTTDVTSITSTTSASGGNVTASGGSAVTARGVCWSTSTGPTTANSLTTNGAGTGVFTSNLTSLTPGATYYVRAYATNSAGTAYGAEKSFITLIEPTVTTNDLSNITATTATGGGEVTFAGNATVTARGVCWSTSQNPTTANNISTNGSGTGSFISNLIGLTPNTTYYVRAYATNSVGTAYGTQRTFKTGITLATISTATTTSITAVSAISGGNISSDGGSTIIGRGVCWNTSPNPTLSNSQTFNGTGIDSFSSILTELLPNTTYYIRSFATNSSGTSYGNEISFKTQDGLPVLSTASITEITPTSAMSGGTVTNDWGFPVTIRGVCLSKNPNPTIANTVIYSGNGLGSYFIYISPLAYNTKYYLRAFASNSIGTSYGGELVFTTLKEGQITDADGNIYNTVIIGSQVWMAENLRTTKYYDGTSTPAVTWFNDDIINKEIYGGLYSFYWHIASGKLCPIGWHIPSDEEWTSLSNFLGGESVAGGKLKEIGTTHWSNPNTGATNEAGFTGLPGGYRSEWGNYYGLGLTGSWWSSTFNYKSAEFQYYWGRSLSYDNATLIRNSIEYLSRRSVRCIKD